MILGWPLAFGYLVWRFQRMPGELSDREEERLLAEFSEQQERERLLSLTSDTGWRVPYADAVSLEGERWWTTRWRTGSTLLVVQENGVFDRYWCAYELCRLEPRLIAALPMSEYRSAEELLADVPSIYSPKVDSLARWTQVPAYVGRSLAATAAWVGRNA